MDVRRIVFSARSLVQRSWPHKRIRRALSIVIFLLPSLLVSMALVPASQATRAITPGQGLVSFIQRDMNVAFTAASTPPTAIPVAIPVVNPTVPPAPVVVPEEPTAPAPAATPAPAVDSSSAAAWAASPGVACIRDDESGDDYSTNTGNGYYGAYQDALSTWESHGGTGLPSDAPPAVQDQINYEIFLTGGWGQWGTAPGCGL